MTRAVVVLDTFTAASGENPLACSFQINAYVERTRTRGKDGVQAIEGVKPVL